MFDIGGGELILLFVIGMLVLGPQRLPKVAAEIGKWIGRARRTANELRRQLEREIALNDIQPPPPPPTAEAPAAPTAGVTEHAPTEPAAPAAAQPTVGVPTDSAPAPETPKPSE